MQVAIANERARIDAFHARFNAAAAGASTKDDGASSAPQSNADEQEEGLHCDGCGVSIERSAAQWCGACRCAAYCDKDCQRAGWKAGGHKAACKLLSQARALPPADPDRGYVVQLKLEGRQGLRDWADKLERDGQGDVAPIHREMAEALGPRERVLFALEARHHFMLGFEVVPPTKRLEAHYLALFALRAILKPAADIPTLNMSRGAPHRPYAIWIPGEDEHGAPLAGDPRAMAGPVGRLLSAAGLATTNYYVGPGFCAEMQLRPGESESMLNVFVGLDPDLYTDDEDEEDEEDAEGPTPRGGEPHGAAAATGSASGRVRALLIAGMHVFGPDAGEGEDPMLDATVAALRSAGVEVEVAMYPKGRKGAEATRAQAALAQRLANGGFAACVVLGLGAGDDFKPRNPTHPWADGPWREGLGEWVRRGGALVLHGERAAAAVVRSFFGLSWTMDGDFYRRTDHILHPGCPLLGPLARRLPRDYNVKACMLSDVPPAERIYATAPGARSHSLVPAMAGAAVDAGRTAVAAARVGGGAVVFFGDVNWEPPTMAAVAGLVVELGKGPAGGGGGAGR